MGREYGWTVGLTDEAKADFRAAIQWSRKNFGVEQARKYSEVLIAAIQELRKGPRIVGVKSRSEIVAGLLSLHVARHGRRGRHLVMFHVVSEELRILEVLRLLHDSMDIPSRLQD